MSHASSGFLARRVCLLVLATSVALLTILFFTPLIATAQSNEASWSGSNITYQERVFQPMAGGGPFHDAGFNSVVPAGSTAYSHHEQNADPPKAHIIYFSQGATPRASASANYVIFDYDTESGGASSTYTNPGSQNTISITPASTDSTDQEGEATQITSSCDIDHGLGWAICPLTNTLADGMDWLFDNVLTHFLRVPPILTNVDSAMYRGWSYMRNIANIMFVITFMIVVYSQVTTIGISNYGIKKLLPRLVVAAILVNISYYVVAFAVDMSNLLGHSLQDMFMAIREDLVIESDYTVGWRDIAMYVLSGGAVAVTAVGAGVLLAPTVGAALGGTISTAFIMLLPVLLGAVLSVIIAILVLAARQAIIAALVILSPLAFVAYLLPNTEKYFSKWKDLFMTMLMIFPIFSVVYGGAQLAGAAIIDSASSAATGVGLPMIILGLSVQVIPLAITPFLVRISGSMLGQLAGALNAPKNNLVSRARGLTDGIVAQRRAEHLHGKNSDRSYKNNSYLARKGRQHDAKRREREALTKAYESASDEEFKNSEAYKRAHDIQNRGEIRGRTGESEANRRFYESLRGQPDLQRDFLRSKLAQDQEEDAKLRSEDLYSSLRADPSTAVAMAAISNHIMSAEQEAEIEGIATAAHSTAVSTTAMQWRDTSHKRVQDSRFREAIINDESLRTEAAGSDPNGRARVLNIAEEGQSKMREEIISASSAAYSRKDATVQELYDIILGQTPPDGRFAAYKDPDDRSAAVRSFMKVASGRKRIELMSQLDISSNADNDAVSQTLRSELAAALRENKPFILPISILQQLAEGDLDPANYHGENSIKLMIESTLNNYGLGAESMVSADRDELMVIAEWINDGGTINADARDKIIENFEVISDKNGLYYGKLQKNRIELNAIRTAMNSRMGLGIPPLP